MRGKRATPTPPVPQRDAVLEEIIDLIKENERFALTTHLSPEGDALGSALALRLILRRLGKEALILLQDAVPQNLRFLKGAEGIRSPKSLPEQFDPEVWFVLDCANLERAGEALARLVLRSGRPIVNIDHHLDNSNFGQVNYVRQTAAAAQLIFELARALEVIDPEIATSIYAGIVADTDAFRNANTDALALRDAAALMEHGARANEVIVNLYERRTPGELRLLGWTLLHAQIEDSLAWAALSRQTFAELGASHQDTEHLVDTLRTLDGVRVALLFKELDGGRVKVSFRAKGGFKVNEVARHFGGGGHEQAAGCVISGELARVEGMVLAELRRRLDASQP
ncbi:MAG: bifunctional oligoribonuclease/PAP phosphatase NrnA [Candidatus Acetothermia bacterium]|jgi:phosphoesterase RecJ-like protein|nr:bifunctional oligoribonuclease/PAP phosphatase NrnA [Candidatus Acetothermia bacterium]MDH7504872.1 bifunctional oligoribonuclease/PAP phosphatase NrnA [Candidatus Acetothermia bacterium]